MPLARSLSIILNSLQHTNHTSHMCRDMLSQLIPTPSYWEKNIRVLVEDHSTSLLEGFLYRHDS